MTALENLINHEIQAQGAMRFDRYMELALYHPEHGYYAGSRAIGRTGDYLTSVSVGPLFGQLLARQVKQVAELLDEPVCWIFEQGAHDGQLAHDILSALREEAPAVSNTARYGIIEPNLRRRNEQQQTLGAFTNSVCWFVSLAEAQAMNAAGLFLSNELVDAMPVRLIERAGGGWHERHVSIVEEQLGWVDLPIVDAELQNAIADLPLPNVPKYRSEVHLGASRWMLEVAQVLRRGLIFTIDYGFPASSYYAPFRASGTLTTYCRHRRGDNVLLTPGERDITAHVNFTALIQSGERGGLTPLALLDQQRFLTGIARTELEGAREFRPGLQEQSKAWQTLTHPQHLGTRFQVLIQTKGLGQESLHLDGLHFARPGGWD